MNEAFSMTDFIWLVPTLPLVGFLVNILLGRRLSRRWVGLVACGTVGVAAGLSLALFFHLTGLQHRQLSQELFTWIGIGDFNVSVSFLLDPLSAVMILVVTWIGFLIHLYSVGYMAEDRDYARYFAFLNLFVFFMLLLVLADNFLLLFVGWEGVGLCSYLLIGFWFERPAAAAAAEKAFVVNRVGDAGFLLGLFLIWTTFGTLEYAGVFQQVEGLHGQLTEPALGGLSLVTWITLALFVGAMGKSAQLPLYVWLPDAMEGPTPVSALIHAATMVTAGVYMVARSSPLYNLAPTTLGLVAMVGAVTAVFAATIACVQNDIKRVIAYSTISQLGYMFLGAGVGAYASGIFHLYTHAAFKALLFLGAGAVIHGLHQEQDIQRMGGLRPHMKVTAYTFGVGALANAGIFPLAGFWSKDEILFAAFNGGHYVLWVLGLAGAFLTAFYMARLYFLTFEGQFRGDPHHVAHVHDAPPTMAIPLIVLAIGSVVVGFVGIPPEQGPFHQFLAPVLHHGGAGHGAVSTLALPLAALSLLVAVAGIGVAYLLYLKWRDLPELLAARFQHVYQILYHKYYVDELYQDWIVRPLERLAFFLWRECDVAVVDGAVNGVARMMEVGSRGLRRIQTGMVFNYVVSILAGVVLLLGYLILVR
jgi:NADH-quinone oxidoreductase subunit L